MLSVVTQLTWRCNRVTRESQSRPLSRETCEHPCVIQLELPHWVSLRVPSTINHRAHLGQKIVIIHVDKPESSFSNLSLANHCRGDHSLKFSLCFFTRIESSCELQLYALFINQNTQRTTSIQLFFVMRDEAGHRSLSFSKIPQIFWEYESQNLAKKQKRLS